MQAVNFVWKADDLIWRNKSKLRINEIIKKNNYEYVFFWSKTMNMLKYRYK